MNRKILKGVSRSFYLSLILLPRRIRAAMGLAFLACKAADTIADTDLIPKEERLKILDAYRELFAQPGDGFAQDIAAALGGPGGGTPAEKKLIENLPALMEALSRIPPADWHLIQELVLELTQGMQADLQMTRPLETESELEQYTYYVAGCVGRFWTRMVRQHFDFAKSWGREAEDLGEKIGKGLQLVNILRDLPRDLQRGRCYIPLELLSRHRLTPADLVHPNLIEKVRPALLDLAGRAKNYLTAYAAYCRLYPWYALRLKGVVKLPVRLGLQTLNLLEHSPDWLNPLVVHKVPRRRVYQTLIGSFWP